MKGVITRGTQADTGTPGRLILEDGFSCDTLELPWRDNQRGLSCIRPAPGGEPETYLAWIWQSPSMGRPVVRLEDKHGRKDCLVHNGTWAGDVMLDVDGDGEAGDLITQVHGCTLVGMGFGMIQRKDGKMQWGVLSSKDTLAKLVAHLGDGMHELTYRWA